MNMVYSLISQIEPVFLNTSDTTGLPTCCFLVEGRKHFGYRSSHPARWVWSFHSIPFHRSISSFHSVEHASAMKTFCDSRCTSYCDGIDSAVRARTPTVFVFKSLDVGRAYFQRYQLLESRARARYGHRHRDFDFLRPLCRIVGVDYLPAPPTSFENLLRVRIVEQRYRL